MYVLAFILICIVIFLALMTVSVPLFLGGGYLLTLMLDFTLFQATLICSSSSFVLTFFIVIFFSLDHFITDQKKTTITRRYDYDDDDDEDDDDDDDDEDDPPIRRPRRRFRVVRSQKIGRNAPCPCGSGKKYKNCCGA